MKMRMISRDWNKTDGEFNYTVDSDCFEQTELLDKIKEFLESDEARAIIIEK